MGLPHILSGAHVRAEGLGDFGFKGRGGGRWLCRLGLAGAEFYVLLVLELDGGKVSAEVFGKATGGAMSFSMRRAQWEPLSRGRRWA